MSRFNDRQQNELQEITPHVRFDKHERILYGHDIAAMPSLVKYLVGNTTPDGVAQPRTEEELIALLKCVYRENIPVTPRAKASSGYGGVIPVKKGLVIDFYRLKNVVSFDKNDLTVTVEAGMTWEALDKQLKKEGI